MTTVFSGHRISAALLIFLVGMPGLVHAADESSKPDASVPTVTYRSVFRETFLGVETDKVDWRKANDDVGRFTRGHVDILKREEAQDKAVGQQALPPQSGPAPHQH